MIAAPRIRNDLRRERMTPLIKAEAFSYISPDELLPLLTDFSPKIPGSTGTRKTVRRKLIASPVDATTPNSLTRLIGFNHVRWKSPQERIGGYQLVLDSNFGNIEEASGFFDEGKSLDTFHDLPQDLQLFRFEQIRVRDIDHCNPVRSECGERVFLELLIRAAFDDERLR